MLLTDAIGQRVICSVFGTEKRTEIWIWLNASNLSNERGYAFLYINPSFIKNDFFVKIIYVASTADALLLRAGKN
jgi:hypothetical protein